MEFADPRDGEAIRCYEIGEGCCPLGRCSRTNQVSVGGRAQQGSHCLRCGSVVEFIRAPH